MDRVKQTLKLNFFYVNNGRKRGTETEILKKDISLEKLILEAKNSMHEIEVELLSDFYLEDEKQITFTQKKIDIFMKENIRLDSIHSRKILINF